MSVEGKTSAGKRTAALVVLVVVWVMLDQLSKSLVADQQLGSMFAGPFAGLVDFRLVHNTGGAWGIFEGNTVALGVFSLVVCALLAAYYIWQRDEVNMVQTVGIGLVMAGGIGNAIDRFTQGFVTDFIEFSFVDFPVFNVADIGVTCGFVLLFAGLALTWRRDSKDES